MAMIVDEMITHNHSQGISCEIAHYGKSLISVFQRFFASMNKILILMGKLDTRLSFYEVQTLS